jgi:hypothetical protein
MTWHESYYDVASEDVVSDNFELKGSSVHVMWIAERAGTGYGVWMSSGLKTANNAVLELPNSGNYYLNVPPILHIMLFEFETTTSVYY